MKLINYDITKISELVEIYYEIKSLKYNYNNMKDYDCMANYNTFSTVRDYLNKVIKIHDNMSDDFKINYSNIYFNNLNIDIIRSDYEDIVEKLKDVNESHAKILVKWANDILTELDSLKDDSKYNIHKAQIYLKIIIMTNKPYNNPKHAQLCKNICIDADNYLNCIENYILNIDIPEEN